MLFSVLIAHYNNSRYLAAAIESVKNQTYPHWEIIITDDGSTDDFEEVIRSYSNDPRIRIYRNEKNEGCGYTKRRCAELANGQLSGFLDPDDTLHPDALSVMQSAHQENPGHSIICSANFICDDELNVKSVNPSTKPLPVGTPYLLVSDGSIHHFATYKTHLYLQTEGISKNNKKAVDQDLYYKLEETGPVLFIDRPLYYYRIHEGGISTFGQREKAQIAHYFIILEALKRRLKTISVSPDEGSRSLKRAYRERYQKIKILLGYRIKDLPMLISGCLVFPFVGGIGNILSFIRKNLPGKLVNRKEGGGAAQISGNNSF